MENKRLGDLSAQAHQRERVYHESDFIKFITFKFKRVRYENTLRTEERLAMCLLRGPIEYQVLYLLVKINTGCHLGLATSMSPKTDIKHSQNPS